MTQFNMNPINPAVTSGPDLANYLEGVRDAAYSSHLGNSRPPYVRDGMLWIKSVSATAWEVYLANGSNDALIGSLNPVTNTFATAKVMGVYTSAQVDALVGTINANLADLFAELAGKADASALATATTPAGTIAPFAGVHLPAGWLRCDGATYAATAYPALFAAVVVGSTATITIGTNATIGWASHGLGADYPVKFTTIGTLPYLQDAEGVTGIDVEDHGSGDAVAITLQIKPFRPRTLYASDRLYGYAGGLVPDHLEAYSHLLMP